MFPEGWYVTVTRVRGGGTDARGNPLPAERVSVRGCLIGPRSTEDPLDWSQVLDNTAALYRHETAPVFRAGDVVEVPEGARMAGRWKVAGRPGEWPLGLEVPLERA